MIQPYLTPLFLYYFVNPLYILQWMEVSNQPAGLDLYNRYRLTDRRQQSCTIIQAAYPFIFLSAMLVNPLVFMVVFRSCFLSASVAARNTSGSPAGT